MSGATPAREFVAALAAQDWQRLAACFAPTLVFRALTPSRTPFRECGTADEAAELIGRWFGDGEPLELLASSVEHVDRRVHISYRFGSYEGGHWYLVEQHAYATVEDRKIVAMDLLCSGFHPVDEQPVP